MAYNSDSTTSADQLAYISGHAPQPPHQAQHQAMLSNVPVPRPHQPTVSQVTDPQFFRVANPGPLGLISFALTTFVLGLYQCGAG